MPSSTLNTERRINASLETPRMPEGQVDSDEPNSSQRVLISDIEIADSTTALPTVQNATGEYNLTNDATDIGRNGASPHSPSSKIELLELLFARESSFRLREHEGRQLATASDIINRLLGSFATMIEKRACSTKERNAAVLVRRGQE